jgi:RNA processing factor Prp31
MYDRELLAKFDELEKQSLQLITVCETLRAKLRDSEKENAELRDMVKRQATQLKEHAKKQGGQEKDFTNTHKISKLVSSIRADSQETEQLKGKIDEFIQEINKCIAHLSQ